MSDNLSITVESPYNPDGMALIQALDKDLLDRYPSENVYILDLSKIDGETGIFLVARIDNKPVGCGAVCQLEAGVGEIKRVFVIPEMRGQGLSKKIMQVLETKALALGYTTLRLESGDRQPEANGLYKKLGYLQIPNFGEYVGDPHSVCMEKKLG